MAESYKGKFSFESIFTEKGLDEINAGVKELDKNAEKAKKSVDDLTHGLQNIESVKINISTAQARRELAKLEKSIERIKHSPRHTVNTDEFVNIAKTLKESGQFTKELEDLTKDISVKINGAVVSGIDDMIAAYEKGVTKIGKIKFTPPAPTFSQEYIDKAEKDYKGHMIKLVGISRKLNKAMSENASFNEIADLKNIAEAEKESMQELAVVLKNNNDLITEGAKAVKQYRDAVKQLDDMKVGDQVVSEPKSVTATKEQIKALTQLKKEAAATSKAFHEADSKLHDVIEQERKLKNTYGEITDYIEKVNEISTKRQNVSLEDLPVAKQKKQHKEYVDVIGNILKEVIAAGGSGYRTKPTEYSAYRHYLESVDDYNKHTNQELNDMLSRVMSEIRKVYTDTITALTNADKNQTGLEREAVLKKRALAEQHAAATLDYNTSADKSSEATRKLYDYEKELEELGINVKALSEQIEKSLVEAKKPNKKIEKKDNKEAIIKRFNKLMTDIGATGSRIDKENKINSSWNVRDMVAEAEAQHKLRYSLSPSALGITDKDELKTFNSEKGKIERFIKAFEPLISQLTTTENHNSKYDNTAEVNQKKQLDTIIQKNSATKENVEAIKQETEAHKANTKAVEAEKNTKESVADNKTATANLSDDKNKIDVTPVRNVSEIQKDIDDTKNVLKIQQEWIDIFGKYLEEDYMKSSGKKEATEKLRNAVKRLITYRSDPRQYEWQAYAQEKYELNAAIAYKQAEKIGVSDKTLTTYRTDAIDPYTFNKNMDTVKRVVDEHLDIISKQTQKLEQLQAELISVKEKEIKATDQLAKSKIKYYEIDENAARISKQMRSFDDYKEGSATASYKAAIDKIAKVVEDKKTQFPEKSEQLDKLFDRYAKNLATYINKDNQIGARYPSVMISGAGNYNVKKHDKQLASWGKNYQFYEDKVLALENQIRTLGGGAEVIRGDEENALEKLEAKVEYLKYWHQVMVDVNKYYRKNKSLEGFDGADTDELERIQKDLADMQKFGRFDVPYPQFTLANDNQNIKRLEGRIAELKKLKSENISSNNLQEENDIYKLWVDKQDMRIRISFEIGKPEQEIIDMLKGKAFKWSPKNQAWQRQLTNNAVYDTKRLKTSLNEFYGIETQSQPNTIVAEVQPKVQDELVKKEKEHTTALMERTNAANEFAQINKEIILQYQKSEPFMQRYGEITQDILNGNIALEEANKQLNSFVSTLSEVPEEKLKLIANPKNNQEKIYNALISGNELEQSKKGIVNGYSAEDRALIAKAITEGLQQGLKEINIKLGNGGELTIPSNAEIASTILGKLGFTAKTDPLTEFILKEFRKAKKIGTASSGDSHYITADDRFYKTRRRIGDADFNNPDVIFNEMKSLIGIADGYKNATKKLPTDVREVSSNALGSNQKAGSLYLFKTEDGKYIVLNKSSFDSIKKISADVMYNPNSFNTRGIYNGITYGVDQNGAVTSGQMSVANVKNVEAAFNSGLPVSKKVTDTNKNPLNISSFPTKTIEDENKALAKQVEKVESVIENNKQLTSSYKGLVDAVEEYVNTSKKLWDAYDNNKDTNELAKERNAAIDKIKKFLPADNTKGIGAHFTQSGYEMQLQDSHISREFANKGTEFALRSIESDINKSNIELKQIEERVKAEEKLAESINKTTEAKKKQQKAIKETPVVNEVQKEQKTDGKKISEDKTTEVKEQSNVAKENAKIATEELNTKKEQLKVEKEITAEETKRGKTDTPLLSDSSSEEVSVDQIIERSLNESLKQIREAKNNVTSLFNLTDVFSGDDLIEQARNMVSKAALSEGFSLKQFDVADNHIKVTLYNDALKATVQQTYALAAATEEAETKLELVGSKYSQNVKALTENKFDIEGTIAKAESQIKKFESTLNGLKYDTGNLETLAHDIKSQDDYKKFSNMLKAAENEVQAIKNSTATKNTMDPLKNMRRDIQNATTEIETMRISLEKLGDVEGVSKARNLIEQMTNSVNKFNKSSDMKEQQSAYNDYSDYRSQFNAQLKLIRAQEDLKKKQRNEQKQIDVANKAKQEQPVLQTYKSLFDITKNINSINDQIMKYQEQDDGSAIFASYISNLKLQRQELEVELNSIVNDLSNFYTNGYVQGNQKVNPIPSKLIDGESYNSIKAFLNDIKTQAILSEKEINDLLSSFQKMKDIDIAGGNKMADMIKPLFSTSNRLENIQGLKPEKTAPLAGISDTIKAYVGKIQSGEMSWDSDEIPHLKKLIEMYTEYGNTLASTAEKEQKYFESKQKYTSGMKLSDVTNSGAAGEKEYSDMRKKLEDTARKMAEESGKGQIFTTGFSQGADGIAKLDFSVFDSATKSLQNFRLEMGNVTNNMSVTETTVSKSLANINAAQKQLDSSSKLLTVLGGSGINIGDGATKKVSEFVNLINLLDKSLRDGDETGIAKYTKDLGIMSSEIDKAYKQMLKMQDGINNESLINKGAINTNGNVYAQAKQQIEAYAQSIPNATVSVGAFNEQTGKIPFTINVANQEMRKCEAQINSLNGQMTIQEKSINQIKTKITQAAGAYDKFKGSLMSVGKQLVTAVIGYNAFYKVISMFRTGVGYVKEIDLAMTELKKVTDETNATYNQFIKDAYKSASVVGATVSDFTQASANFARLGYDLDQSSSMAQTAIVYKNVADGLNNINDATDSIVSTMKAFNVEASDTMSIADKFNEVGNNYAITSAGIGEALKRSASSLAAAGNTLDESIALVTGANAVVQNPEVVGTALKTLSLRIRGVKTELEEAGLDAENMAETTATLHTKLLALSDGKVDILKNADEFKSTTEILRELAAAWEDMTDMEQAAAIELVAGKRQANVVASLMTNFDIVENAIQTSMDSNGSALKENEKYLQSIQGKTEVLTRSMQEFWNEFINSEVIKYFIDLTQGVVDFANAFGPLKTTLAAVLTYFMAFKKVNPLLALQGFKNQMAAYGNAQTTITSLSGTIGTKNLQTAQISAYAAAVKNLTFQKQAAILATNGLSEANIREVLTENQATEADMQSAMAQSVVLKQKQAETAANTSLTISTEMVNAAKLTEASQNFLLANTGKQLNIQMLEEAVNHGTITAATKAEIVAKFGLVSANTGVATSIKGIGTALKLAISSNPAGFILTVISTVAMLIPLLGKWSKSNDELIQDADQLRNAYNQVSDEIKSNTSTINGLEDEFAKLSKGVNDLGENVSLSADDYARYQEIVQQLVGMSPSIITGYDKEGKAIANKNGLIERSIELMEQEQRLEAQRYTSDSNFEKIKNGIKAEISDFKNKNPLEYGNAKLDFMSEFDKAAAKYAEKKQGNYEGQIYNALNPDDRDLTDFWTENYWNEYGESANNFAADFYSQIVDDLRSESGVLKDYFTDEQITDLLEIAAQYDKNVANYNAQMKAINQKYNKELIPVLQAETKYYELDDDMRGYAQNYVLNLDVNTTNIDAKKKEVQEFVEFMYENQDSIKNIFDAGYQAISKTDKNNNILSYKDYKKQIDNFKKELQDNTLYNDEQKSWILSILGLDTIDEDLKNKTDKIRNTLAVKDFNGIWTMASSEVTEVEKFINSLSTQDLEIFYNISAEPGSMTFDEIANAIQKVKDSTGVGVIGIETHSATLEQFEKYKEILTQTQEVFMDNVEVTEEYKTSLTELGISATELNECFYEANPLVVKNAEKLKELIKNTKNNAASNAKLAKSQAMLKYTKLQKQTKELAGKYKTLTAAEKAQLNAMYDEMSALQKSIAKYSLLEHQLLGTANAYDEFAKAQEIDGSNTYTEQAQDMANTLAEAFNSAKLGTESAQAAIKGLVPESVYKDIDVLDDKMQAIYNYFNGGTLSKYITIKYNDDDHSIEKVEIAMNNMEKFFEDGKAKGVFTGTWDEFDLDPTIKSLDQLAEKMNVTKEVAFAVMQEMEKYDINWLGGDFTTLLDKLSPDFGDIQEFENELRKAFEDVSPQIDVAVRPVISGKKMQEAGYTDVPEDSYATFYSKTVNASDLGLDTSEGEYYINVTPILPDGTVIENDEFEEYLKKKVSKNGKQGLIDSGVYLGSYSSLEDAGIAAETLHEMSAMLEDMKKNLNLETEIYKTSTAMAELEQEFIKGTISEEEYGEQIQKLSVQMSALNETAKEKALSYIELNKEITDVTAELQNAQKELNKDPENEEALKSVQDLSEKYKELAIRKAELGNLSELEMTQALEAANISADNLNESLRNVDSQIGTTIENLEKTYGVIANINSDGGIELSMSSSMSAELKEQLEGIGALKDDGTIDISLFYNELDDEQKKQFDLLNELTGQKNLIEYAMSMDGQDSVQEALDGILQVLTNIFEQLQGNPSLTINTSSAKQNVDGVLSSLKTIVNGTWDKTVTITRNIKDRVSSLFGLGQANGNANVRGHAYVNGKFGAPKTEDALVGELGPEMRVRGNRWELLGENGAEFTRVKKDDIIFNHKQTKQLLENGHINSRGRAYVSGTAYAGINTWVSGYHNTSGGSGNGNGDSSGSDATEEFKEVFDWFEVKLEEINELLDLWGAQLENIVDISGKGAKIDDIIDKNKYKLDILAQGLKLYEDYTNQLLTDIPAQYREAAKNGKIAIETFAGDAGEKTLEAINNYRDWAQKVADVKQQMEELTQTIADLAKQKFDIIDEGYGNKITLMELQIDRLKDSVQLIEDKGNIATSQYYDAMTNITSDRINKLQEEHKLLQKSLNESVEAGDIAKYSDRWYEMVEAIYTVDQEIMECTMSLEEFQNSINEINWDNFDELINRLEYLESETDSLIDLMEQAGEIVNYPKDNEYWGSKDVQWSNEGITSLGLYAQKMEIAEYMSEQYAKAIDSLNKDYKAGKYSMSEYQEKLDELKQAQYDSIKTYYDAQDAIVDLNKTRVDAIKDGINKEIEAYEKLINKKKEELDVEKDMYDFQKNIAEKQKDINAIERKISALSMDNSASAVAQRKKLEAELAEAKSALDETYYDRSITDQQNALDNELENFKEQRDAEIEKWEKYLEDVQKVVADSLGVVQTNAINIYDTLSDKASEYNLTLSDAIMTPWKDGMSAVSSYQETFNTAASSTYEQLGNIKQQWQDIIDLMIKTANIDITNQKSDNQSHIAAEKKPQTTAKPAAKQPTTTQQTGSAKPSTSVGSTITVKSTATHFSTGQRMASFVPGGSYTVYQDNGDRVLIGRNGAYTGWIYKKDIQGYASGTTGVKNNQLAWIDELGEELVMHADGNGKLAFLSKGSSVIPHDITENLIKIGSIDPQEVLNRNRASVGVAPSVANNNVNIDINYGDILHIENFSGNNPEDIAKVVEAQFNKHTKKLNDSLKKYVR